MFSYDFIISYNNHTNNQQSSYLFDNNNQQSLNSSVNINNQLTAPSAFISNYVNVLHGYVHPSITNKHAPFTNRCRSPSPGLFQDIDMFNFSSDTLFGTNYLQDQKADPGNHWSSLLLKIKELFFNF